MQSVRPNPPFGWNDPFSAEYMGEDRIAYISEQMDAWDKEHSTEPQWAKLTDLKAGDTVELHGFDCAQGVVTLERDIFDELFFPCAAGKHYITGQLDPDGYLVGITIRPAINITDNTVEFPIASTRSIPLTSERNTMNLDANDANSVSSFFQSLADKVVLASTLPQKVEELSAVVDKLKADVENYREHMARADEEISNLRRERAALQDENANLQRVVNDESGRANIAETRWSQACQERDRWHNQFIDISEASEVTKRERDDAQMKVMELEDTVRRMADDHGRVLRERDTYFQRLNTIRDAANA